MSRRRKRSKREILAQVLEAIIEHGGLNKHKLQLHAGLQGRHARPYIDDFIGQGLLEWSKEPPTRHSRTGDENYARALIITDRGRQWLQLWAYLNRAEDPEDKLKLRFTAKPT